MTEEELIQGCIKQDRRCQNSLYDKYYPLMSSIAFRYCSSHDEAMQAINMGYLKVFKNISAYDPTYSLATWMRKILVNQLVDEFRKSTQYEDKIDYSLEYDSTYGVEINLAEAKWEEDELRTMLASLPKVTETVFNLFAIDGFKHKEIAEMLTISVGTSKWHVSDARKRLQELLTDRMSEKKGRINTG